MRTVNSIIKGMANRLEATICACRDAHINHRIVVFESDDWGSIRMPLRKGWEELLHLGYVVDKRPYERYDTLESPSDLEALFDVLSRHKDREGNHPVITANMLVANPDFEKIKKDDYRRYSYEPISNTYTRYYGDDKVLSLMRQGLKEGVFMPQSHGREHFNVNQWIRGLQADDKDLLTAFEFGLCGIAPLNHPEKGNLMMNALLGQSETEQTIIDGIVDEGLKIFEQLWGFKSKSFVAPCYLWNDDTERILAQNGVALIQTSRSSKPAFNTSARHFYSGQVNKYGQVYSIRNCAFEPATHEGGESVDALMKQIDKTFKQKKIAVISSHRTNYVGGIDEKNRTRTLQVLDDFLTQLLRIYPDTLFVSSDQLINYYKH